MESITINGKRLRLQTGDKVSVVYHECGKCECPHTEITVERNGIEIAKLGDYFTLNEQDEVFGGIVVDSQDKVLPNPHWVTHIVSGMTAGNEHYIGFCGRVLVYSSDNHDRITFPNDLKFVDKEERLCSECLRKMEAK